MAKQTKSGRPILQIPLQPIDYVMEVLSIAGLLALVGLSVYFYNDLPDRIPTHFGPDGQPDRIGDKSSLWFLPALGLLLFGLMTFINRMPHHFNYMVNITPENAENQYTMATRLIRVLKLVVMSIFAFIVWQTIRIAGGASNGLGLGFLIVPVLTLGTTFYYIYKSVAKQ
jgi:uncharacterized membrane protein